MTRKEENVSCLQYFCLGSFSILFDVTISTLVDIPYINGETNYYNTGEISDKYMNSN